MKSESKTRVAVYHEHLRGGGATQVALHIVEGLIGSGYEVDLVVNDCAGDYRFRVPAGVNIVSLSQASQGHTRLCMVRAASSDLRLLRQSLFVGRKQLDKLLYLPSLVRYLRRRQPVLIISNLWQLALVALSGRAIAVPTTRVICVFHSAYFHYCAQRIANARRPRKWRNFLDYCGRIYASADALVTVSDGIAGDLIQTMGVLPDKIQTIHNPVIDTTKPFALPPSPDHPWFKSDQTTPVLIAVGRLSSEKNHTELIQALSLLHTRRHARLIILGEGSDRGLIERQIDRLGLKDDVDLPGWIADPEPYLCHADLFVLTSQTEGLPLVLIEALACGCASVAYDCPHGPREILKNGGYGSLVPLGDVDALAQTMHDMLSRIPDRDALIRHGRSFSIESSVAQYMALADKVLRRTT